MSANRIARLRYGLPLATLSLTSCGRAPSFDILGSFFPAWLICFVVAILLTVLSRELLRRSVEIVWPIVTYPSLTAFFAFALWLTLFR
ncbi:MAG TPA: YtcA family lipoprotein [Candidatus Acidoferrum sp.]|jgi:YtcA family|nr:YtcA family lipoprotein [Candidatus Acidoferrum sp.]